MENNNRDYDFVEKTLDGAEYVLTEYASERSENLQEDVEHTMRGLRNILENNALEDHTDYVREITSALRENVFKEDDNTQNLYSEEVRQVRKADLALRAINEEMNLEVKKQRLNEGADYTTF